MLPPGIIVGFVRGTSLYSKLIELKGSWLYSHVTTLMPGGRTVIDSTWFLADYLLHESRNNGVQERPLSYLDGYRIDWFRFDCSEEQARGVYADLRGQLRKPYDRLGIVDFFRPGHGQDRNFRDRSAWFCDELAVWTWERNGLCRRIDVPPYRIDPSCAAILAQASGAVPYSLGSHRRNSRLIGSYD